MARRIEVEIVGDSRSLERAFARSERSARSFGQNMERAGRGAVVASVGFRGLGRSVAFASAAFLGGAGLAAAAKAGFDEMARGEAVAADTAAALKSTGSVAGVTAREIEALGTSLQRLTGYDDEAIRSAENLILTFTSVRNVAGKGNDIFNQATRSTLDLSRRFDQDLSTSAVQLGKALQDPIRGVTALRRAGVSFSGAQQQVITKLVNTGHLLEAQKILLREVRVETGGAAEAYGKTLPGALDILQGNLENLAGELVTTLNPEMKKLTDRFNAWLENPDNKTKIIDGFASAVAGLGEAFRITGLVIDDTGKALSWFTRNVLAPAWNVIEKIPGIDAGIFGRKGPFTPAGLGGPIGKAGQQSLLAGLKGPLTSGGATPPPSNLATPKAAAAKAANAAPLIPEALQLMVLDARLSGNLARIKGALAAEVAFLQGAIQKTTNPARLLELKQALLGVTDEIQSIDDTILDNLRAHQQALKDAAEKLKSQAADIKSAVLDALETRHTRVTNQRALTDALKDLRLANMLGGAAGIEAARRSVEDARFAIRRQQLAATAFTLTPGPPGPMSALTVGNVTINVNGAGDPDAVARKVIDALNRARKHGVHQFSGTAPNHNTMT